MYFEEEEELPILIPISRKKKVPSSLPPEAEKDHHKPNPERENFLKPEPIRNIPSKEGRKSERQSKEPDLARIQEFDSRFKAMNEQVKKKEEEQKIKMTDKFKETQKAKSLIDQLLHKINAKNVTEQLYPVTNETIEALIRKADQQIRKLNQELERRQSSLTLNPSNLNLKAEVEALKSSIDRAVTIKELYHQKINQRNKIMTLERSIIGLKEENANLKIKINRGIETIQKHMHNLPCEKQKQLLQELDTLRQTYQKEKEMRAQLQSNISDIVLNFKRLYQEADTARLIVTRKLQQVLQKQKLLSSSNYHHHHNPHQHSSEDRNTPKNSPAVSAGQARMDSLKVGQIKNFSAAINLNKTPPKIGVTQNNKGTTNKSTTPPILSSMFSLEDQIKKMRNNQRTVTKHRY